MAERMARPPLQDLGRKKKSPHIAVEGEIYMSLISLILNILWIITGGIWMAAGWLLAAIVMAITIVGLPWARSAVNIASYTLAPFGRTAVSREEWDGRTDFGTSPLGMLGNVIWFVLAGWWLALGHLLTAVALALTIVGIPFAWAHLKLAVISLWPIGKRIVSNEELEERARAGYRIQGSH
jgi:uncharacterized membrane protein YccF (DUF307 family)